MNNPTELPDLAYDKDMDRHYIPLPGGWEIQTKGKGSTFRIAHAGSGRRWMVLDDQLRDPLVALASAVRDALARRAQPDGEAQQASTEGYLVDPGAGSAMDRVYRQKPDAYAMAEIERRGGSVKELIVRPAASLSPLCGAQHADSGKQAKPDIMRIRDEVDWKNGLTQLLEDYKHATDHGIMSRESVQERVIDYVLTRPALAAQQAAAPADCSGTPSSCPDNEGYGCHCSAPGTPEAPKGYQIVPIKLPEQLVDQLASATYDLDDAAREIVREDWARALGMLRAAQLDGGKEGSAT